MIDGFDNVHTAGKEQMDRAMRSFGVVTKGMQAIALEMADYSKASIEETTSAAERVMGAKSLDKVIEAQSDYMRTSYDTFVSRMNKIGEMYADIARDAYKPYDGPVAKAGK